MKNRILILYTELSIYTVNCLNYYSQNNTDVEIHIIHWSINQEAPFVFNLDKRVFHHEKVNLNDPDMALTDSKSTIFETSIHAYREGSSGANGGKSGGGCGCN